MAQVNVNKRICDPFYRYKMPKLIAKVEGRGNGIKTVVSNMSEVAKSLNVPPAYPTKYIGIELGAQVILDSKNDRYIINGSHDNSKLQNVLYEFIDKYLLCSECENPETYMIASVKRDKIKMVCKACGHSSFLAHSHRLNTYIIKNPPKHNSSIVEIPIANIIVATSEIATDPIKNEVAYNGGEKSKTTEWLTDTSSAAVQVRMAALSAKAAELTLNSDLEKSTEERYNMLVEYSKKLLAENTPENVQSIIHESKRLDLGATSVFAICNSIFTDAEVGKKIKTYKNLLSTICQDASTQRNLLSSIEVVVIKYPDLVLAKIVQIFRLLYSLDIVEEDTFLAWSSKKSNRYLEDQNLVERIHKAADPFITWLKTAEVESSEESEDDDIIAFTRVSSEKLSNAPDSASRHGLVVNEQDDDINIDDI
ncbi:hypothetical protein MXB_1026 [Myxobolus squamalis]|nr:hypothetical protein MXB_1026 [Myxobolus squamalis]